MCNKTKCENIQTSKCANIKYIEVNKKFRTRNKFTYNAVW